MGKYIDLCTVIDVEPEVSQVLGLIEDEDLLSEFWQRMDEGLIIAEIELPRKDMPFEKPQWLGKEVTQDTTYYNSTLSKTSWKAIQKSRAEAKAWDDWRDSLVKK